jgi:hypothetical protein
MNEARALELVTIAAAKTRAAIAAHESYKSARTVLREARIELREANKALRNFLAGKDPEAQMPLPLTSLSLNGDGHLNGSAPLPNQGEAGASLRATGEGQS